MPLKQRILQATGEIDRALLFSTLIMVCASCRCSPCRARKASCSARWPQTYAFSLAGALVLALTLSPVLCMFCSRTSRPSPDNFLVRS